MRECRLRPITAGPCALIWLTRFNAVEWPLPKGGTDLRLLRRHADRTAILREVGR
jgi:hypothetical protein